MSLYPLTLEFPAVVRDGTVDIHVVIDRDGWRFAGTLWAALFTTLPASERLRLRSIFERQAELAQNTPTKGER